MNNSNNGHILLIQREMNSFKSGYIYVIQIDVKWMRTLVPISYSNIAFYSMLNNCGKKRQNSNVALW